MNTFKPRPFLYTTPIQKQAKVIGIIIIGHGSSKSCPEKGKRERKKKRKTDKTCLASVLSWWSTIRSIMTTCPANSGTVPWYRTFWYTWQLCNRQLIMKSRVYNYVHVGFISTGWNGTHVFNNDNRVPGRVDWLCCTVLDIVPMRKWICEHNTALFSVL